MKNLAKNHTYEYLKGLYLIRYLGDAFFYTFLYVFLRQVGASTSQLGLVSAVTPLAAFGGNIIFRKIAKNLDVNRILMVVLNIIELAVAFIFAFFSRAPFYFYLILIMVVSFLNTPFYSLLDGYSGTYITARNKQYSSMRIMGTFSYVIGPLVGGIFVENINLGYEFIFLLAALFFLLTMILTFYLPKQILIDNENDDLVEKISIKKNRHLLVYLLFNFFVISLSIVSDNFYGVYLTETLGLTTAQYGYLISAAILVESLTFIFIIFRKNMFSNPTFAYFLIGTMILLRPLSVALNVGITITYIMGVFRGIAWGYYLVFNVRYLARILPLKYLTSALFLASIASTLGRVIFSLSIGEALNHYSYGNVFLVISLVILSAIGLTMTLSEHLKKKEKRETFVPPQSL